MGRLMTRGSRGGKGVMRLIKDNISRNIDLRSKGIQTKISFRIGGITKKYTLFGTKIKFVLGIRMYERKASTTKTLKK